MKLSGLSTDQALDVLCELTPYISNIASDKDVVSTVGKVVDTGEDMNSYGKFLILAERLGEITPVLLKTHRTDVYGILSVLNGKTVEEISAQPVGETIRQVREAFSDMELLRFFKSSARREQAEPSVPSADSHDSE